MKPLGILVLLFLLPGPAIAVTLDLALETAAVPLHGAACGVLAVANDQPVTVEVACPSFLRQTLWFEVRAGGGTVQLRAADGAALRGGGTVALAPGEAFNVPFYVMKADGKSVFAREGSVEFRAVARVLVAGDWQEIATEWVTLTVSRHPQSDAWRRAFAAKRSVLLPFSHHPRDESLRRFEGSPYYRAYCIYQRDGLDLVRSLAAGEEVGRRYDEMVSQVSGSLVGGGMWTSLLKGEYSLGVRELGDGDYFLGL